MMDKRQVIQSYPGPVCQASSDDRVRGKDVGHVILDAEETIVLGDAATDPYEMEAHETNR